MEIKVIPNKTGSKERIEIDGEVFLKAAPAGRWNYIVEIELLEATSYAKPGTVYIGKSGDRAAAEKWTPHALNLEESVHPRVSKAADYERFEELKKMPGARVSSRNGVRKVTVPRAYTRRIHKIEREA